MNRFRAKETKRASCIPAETQSLEDSIDEIDLRVREQEMLRLRHFRELAEQRVEEKVQRIQNIMNETNSITGLSRLIAT